MLRNIVLRLLESVRHKIGVIECWIIGRHLSSVHFFGGEEYEQFYPCERCGNDSLSGMTFKKWLKINGHGNRLKKSRYEVVGRVFRWLFY